MVPPFPSRSHLMNHGGQRAHARKSAARPISERREALKRGASPFDEVEVRWLLKHLPIELEQQSTKPQPHESKDVATQPKATNDQGHSCHGNKLPEPVDTPIPSQNPAPFAGAVGDAQNNHSTEAETVPVLDEEFDESDAEVIPEMGKSKTKEKSKEVSMEEAGVLNTLQKPQTANTTAPDAFKNDPVLRFAKSNLPGFYERVRKGEGTACRMQELLIFMKQIAENEGVLYESLDGFPMEHTVGYAISDDCWISFLSLLQLWPNQRETGSWFGAATLDALVKLNIREVHDPTRMFLSTDDLVPWLTDQNKHSVEKMLGDVLRNPDVTLQASGRTNFRFRDTQQKPERDRELTFPPIPDDVDTVLFPYCPYGNHWVAVEIVADSLSRLTVSVFNSIPGRKIEFEYAQKELGLLTRVLGRVQANGKFTNAASVDFKDGLCPSQENSDDCGPLTVHAITERFRSNSQIRAPHGSDLRVRLIHDIHGAIIGGHGMLEAAPESPMVSSSLTKQATENNDNPGVQKEKIIRR